MKPKIKKLWIEALTSGEYKQGKGALNPAKGKFCCLGVLCDLHDKSKKRKKSNWDEKGNYLGADLILPAEVSDWAGLPSNNPLCGDHVVAEYNDGLGGAPKKTFKGMAKLIEQYL